MHFTFRGFPLMLSVSWLLLTISFLDVISVFTLIDAILTPIFSAWQGFIIEVLSLASVSSLICCEVIWSMIKCFLACPITLA